MLWESKYLSQSDHILYHWYKIFEHCILSTTMKFRQHSYELLCKSQWGVAEAKTKQIYTGFNDNLSLTFCTSLFLSLPIDVFEYALSFSVAITQRQVRQKSKRNWKPKAMFNLLKYNKYHACSCFNSSHRPLKTSQISRRA